MPNDFYPDRIDKNNPMTAVNKFLNKNKKFEIDPEINNNHDYYGKKWLSQKKIIL